MKTPLSQAPLCEVNMNGQVWMELPGIIFPAHFMQNKSCREKFQSIQGTQYSDCWGHNGMIKAPYSVGERYFCMVLPTNNFNIEGTLGGIDPWPL